MDDAVPEHFTASLAGRQSARSQILLTYLPRSTNFGSRIPGRQDIRLSGQNACLADARTMREVGCDASQRPSVSLDANWVQSEGCELGSLVGSPDCIQDLRRQISLAVALDHFVTADQ
jgi:hypothetical protein